MAWPEDTRRQLQGVKRSIYWLKAELFTKHFCPKQKKIYQSSRNGLWLWSTHKRTAARMNFIMHFTLRIKWFGIPKNHDKDLRSASEHSILILSALIDYTSIFYNHLSCAGWQNPSWKLQPPSHRWADMPFKLLDNLWSPIHGFGLNSENLKNIQIGHQRADWNHGPTGVREQVLSTAPTCHSICSELAY